MVTRSREERPMVPTSKVEEPRPITLDPLFGIPSNRILPKDFDMGALKPVEPHLEEAVSVVGEALLLKQRGQNIEDLVHPAYRWFLLEELKSLDFNGIPIRQVRIGQVKKSDAGIVEVPCKFIAASKSVLGTFLLEKQDSTWYITDFLIDWSELTTSDSPISPSAEKFDPFVNSRKGL